MSKYPQYSTLLCLHETMLVVQAETQQREISHKEERALLEAALEERVASLDTLHQTAADAETARAELQSRADELQVSHLSHDDVALQRDSIKCAATDYQADNNCRGRLPDEPTPLSS